MTSISQAALIISTFLIFGRVQLGSTKNEFIYGGGYAELGDHPHHAHLQSKNLYFFNPVIN
jgi:hypothetical protein